VYVALLAVVHADVYVSMHYRVAWHGTDAHAVVAGVAAEVLSKIALCGNTCNNSMRICIHDY